MALADALHLMQQCMKPDTPGTRNVYTVWVNIGCHLHPAQTAVQRSTRCDHNPTVLCCAVSTRTPGDKFNKEYAYNIRYNYGQEGKRQDWSEWNCVKIISQVGVGAA